MKIRANAENWTRDLFLTKEALYHWATPASDFLSGRPGSNRRHSAWKADALPTELLPHYCVGRAGFEPAKLKTADLQSALVGRLSISPIFNMSRWRDSNPRPADYKSAALASWATSA